MTSALRSSDPLRPSPDEARGELRRELLRPEYEDTDLLQRLLDWVERLFNTALQAATTVSPLAAVAAIFIFFVLAVALISLLSRVRFAPRRVGEITGPVLEEQATAAELRRRAEEALAQGRHEDAVVDGFRALARRQIERGRLDDVPGATAHEVAGDLEERYEDERVGAVAVLFDAVRYGDRPSSRDDAVGVLALDDDLGDAR